MADSGISDGGDTVFFWYKEWFLIFFRLQNLKQLLMEIGVPMRLCHPESITGVTYADEA